MEMFDDMSRAIKFNIEENDAALTIILDNSLYEWALDIDDFYGYYFDVLDNIVIVGGNDVILVNGPLITDEMTGE